MHILHLAQSVAPNLLNCKIHTLCDTHHPLAVNDALLREARLQLHGALRKELPEISLLQKYQIMFGNYSIPIINLHLAEYSHLLLSFHRILTFRTPSPENVQQQIIGTTTNGGKHLHFLFQICTRKMNGVFPIFAS